jgi:RNA polymerase sigma factor (sigma-70 family)
MPAGFDHAFEQLFDNEFARVFRYLDRLSGEPDLAADLAQEAFIRLYQRGSMPERPIPWLVTVAMNLFRNVRNSQARRARLLAGARVEMTLADPPGLPDQDAENDSVRVRKALNALTERERELLLLRAEGYSYGDLAVALQLHQPSIGTLLARAKRAFRDAYGEGPHAP